MSPDDYQQVKEIFQSVLELPTDRRAEELDVRCPDLGVRREVERLLGSYESGYLEEPAAGKLTADALNNGHQLGHYKIVSKIGSGGMGEVYLAEDGKLGRQVAIKLLPETFIEDVERHRRFEQEARTASALNHPNILTIFEIGKTDNTHYIATEYVEGETLRSRLNRGSLRVSEALDVAVQCASALAAAHDSGIIHRDIKPENIMLRRDNLVKLLDFGLAKLVEKRETALSHDALTEKHVKTAPGVIMGTVQYMSPEQTRGQATDTRTDIWSLGCVIYEMLAGNPPFRGDTTADLIAEIVKSYPAPLSATVADIPERLEEIVAKALEKDPDERYQTAKDLVIDLKRLRRKFEVESELERSNPRLVNSGEHESNVTTGAIVASPTKASSVEYLVVGMKLHKRTAIGIAVGLVALVGGTAYVARTYWNNSNDARFAYADKIRRAGKALDTSNFSLARQLLDEAKPRNGDQDLRDFEWGYLSQLHAERTASQPMKLSHPGWVDAVAFSPDGNSLATAGGGDNIVRIWDVATGTEVKRLTGHTELVASVAFSPDGTRLLSGSFDKTARLWDLDTGNELQKIESQTSEFSSLVFLPDGKVAGVNGGIKVWDASTGAEITNQLKPPGMGWPLASSSDGKLLAAQDGDNAMVVWEAATGHVIRKLGGKVGLINDIKFSSDSKSLLVGTNDSSARLWDLKTGKELKTFKGHTAAIQDVAFASDGKTIATGSDDGTIKVWDVEKGFEIVTLQGHLSVVRALAFSPDGQKIASGSFDNTACLWNVPKTHTVPGVLRGHTESVEDVAFSLDGKLLASASKDKTARVWEIATERERLPLRGHKAPVNAVAFSPDPKIVATGSEDGKVVLWDAVTGRQSSSFDSGTGISKLLFSPNGNWIATGHFFYGPGVGLWESATGMRRCGFGVESNPAWDVQFSKDGKQVTASFGDDAVHIWDSASCAELQAFNGTPGEKYGSTFRNDRKLIAIRLMNNERALALIDAETWKEITSIVGHDAGLTSAILSPEGKRLVTSGEDSLVKVWDTATGQELLSLKVGATVKTTAFSPNGKILAAAASDGTVRLWRSEGN